MLMGFKEHEPHPLVNATDALVCREKAKLWKEVKASGSQCKKDPSSTSVLNLPPLGRDRWETSRPSHLFIIGNHLPKSSTIFHSLQFRVNKTIPDQLARSTGRCK